MSDVLDAWRLLLTAAPQLQHQVEQCSHGGIITGDGTVHFRI
jgi:hypothetical protein